MGIIKGLVDFAQFKEFVTPGFLKILYLVIFILMNVGGLLWLAFLLVTGGIGALGMLTQDIVSAIVSIIVLVIMLVVFVIVLIFYNLFFRMYFEVVLLMFNIHGYLKSMDDKMGHTKK